MRRRTQSGMAATALLLASGMLLSACGSSPMASKSDCLQGGNWTEANRNSLNSIIGKYQGQGKAAIFDWDNTTQVRDIGAASFGQLQVNGDLVPSKVPASFSPTFTSKGKTYTSKNLVDYNNGLGDADNNQMIRDTDFPQNMWEAQLFAELKMTPGQVMAVASQAYDNGAGKQDVGKNTLTQVGTGGAAAPRPFLYEEMVDLYGCLIKNGFNVHVTSASDVWTVRWMAMKVLNPALAAKFGPDVQLPVDHVMGIQFMLRNNKTGELHDDSRLIRADTPEARAYQALDPQALDSYTITNINSEIPTDDAGKPANVREWVTLDTPALVAGDSQGDFENFTNAENKLFIARLTEPTIESAAVTQYVQDDPATWIVQPTLFDQSPGHVPSQENLNSRLPDLPASEVAEVAKSIKILTEGGMLTGFTPPPTTPTASPTP